MRIEAKPAVGAKRLNWLGGEEAGDGKILESSASSCPRLSSSWSFEPSWLARRRYSLQVRTVEKIPLVFASA